MEETIIFSFYLFIFLQDNTFSILVKAVSPSDLNKCKHFVLI